MAIPAWERRGAVAVGIVARGSGPAGEAVGGTPVPGAGTRGAVADLAEPTGCADVSDCRLRGWRGCCDQKRYPSLRDPSTVPSSTTAFLSILSFFPFLSSPLLLPLPLLLLLHLHLRLLVPFVLYLCSPYRSSLSLSLSRHVDRRVLEIRDRLGTNGTGQRILSDRSLPPLFAATMILTRSAAETSRREKSGRSRIDRSAESLASLSLSSLVG